MNKIRKGDEVIVIAGRDKGKRGTTYTVRWAVEGNPHQRTFTTNPGSTDGPGRDGLIVGAAE